MNGDDYKERRQWALLQAAALLYAVEKDRGVSYKQCVLDTMGLLAEIQNLESGEEPK